MCTMQSHEELKRHRDAYLAATEPVPGGNQILDDEEGHVELELRTCRCCGSTLCVVVTGTLH